VSSSIPEPPLFHDFDAAAAGLLPSGWQDELSALASSDDMQVLEEHPFDAVSGTGPWRFAVLPADLASLRLGWLWQLYHGEFRQFASARFGRPLCPSNRRSSTTTLNRLDGLGASNGWHRDANPVTGVFYGSTLELEEGGQLQLRDASGAVQELAVRAGTFVCFAGPTEHRVAPLLMAGERLAVAMTYYDSPEDQPFTNESDRYVL
jgi:hypothetical protein